MQRLNKATRTRLTWGTDQGFPKVTGPDSKTAEESRRKVRKAIRRVLRNREQRQR